MSTTAEAERIGDDPTGGPDQAPPADVPVVRTSGLLKRFPGGQVAVDGIDLEVPAGSIFGFLGPNGSGKTTTIRMLLGLIARDGGSIDVLGRSMPDDQLSVLPQVGTLVEGPAFYPFWSGRGNLIRFDQADRHADPRTRRRRIDAALSRVGLSAAADKKVKAYSLGMRQRLALAVALLQPRRLLILDEPTNGLDPQGTREVRALIRDLASDGTTVFLSTHLLSEVEQMCTHVAVMSRGRLLRTGTVSSLLDEVRPTVRVQTPDPQRALMVLAGLDLREPAVRVHPDHLEIDPGDRPTHELAAALVAGDVRIDAIGLQRPSLEEAFVALTGEGFDVAE